MPTHALAGLLLLLLLSDKEDELWVNLRSDSWIYANTLIIKFFC